MSGILFIFPPVYVILLARKEMDILAKVETDSADEICPDVPNKA